MMKARNWVAILAAGSALAFLTGPAGAAVAGDHPPAAAGPQVVDYPADLQRAGEEGTVAIEVFVTSTGRIHKARLTHSSGNDRLDTAAVQSVMGWKFNPAEEGGKPVAGSTVVRVVYKIPAPGQSQ